MNVQISQEDYNALVNLSIAITRLKEKIEHFENRGMQLCAEIDNVKATYQSIYNKICKEKRLNPSEQHTFSVAQPTQPTSLDNDGDPTQS